MNKTQRIVDLEMEIEEMWCLLDAIETKAVYPSSPIDALYDIKDSIERYKKRNDKRVIN